MIRVEEKHIEDDNKELSSKRPLAKGVAAVLECMVTKVDPDADMITYAEECQKEVSEAYMRLTETSKFYQLIKRYAFTKPFDLKNIAKGGALQFIAHTIYIAKKTESRKGIYGRRNIL